MELIAAIGLPKVAAAFVSHGFEHNAKQCQYNLKALKKKCKAVADRRGVELALSLNKKE